MTPIDPDTRTTDWLLERIALGALAPEALAEARARLMNEPGGAARLAALEEDNRATLARHRPEQVAAEVGRRQRLAGIQEAHALRPPRKGPLWVALPLGAALGIALLVTAAPDDLLAPSRTAGRHDLHAMEEERIKGGGPRLLVHRRGASGQPQLLVENAQAEPGDLLQLSYQSDGRAYGAILSVDGRGTVTDHLPESGARAVALEGAGTVALAHAYELDDAPDFEQFLLVTSDSPFALEPVRAALKRAAVAPGTSPSLPAGLESFTFLLRKATP